MTPSLIALVNKSTLVDTHSAAIMARACNSQLRRHVAPAWQRGPMGVASFHTETDVPPGAFPMILLDDPDQAGVLGYHDETPAGQVYGRVFARPVLDNGGDLLTKPLSVASVVSHECCEVYGDQAVNLWASRDGKTSYAYELCDPVEADSYPISVAGFAVTISNFVLPAWFDPHGHGPFDYLGHLNAPFTMAKGGYVIVQAEGKVSQQFAAHYPAWRLATKGHPASRTARRLR